MVTVWLLGALVVPAWTVKESDAGLTSSCTELGDPVMVMVKLAVAVFPQGSVANKVNVDGPAVAEACRQSNVSRRSLSEYSDRLAALRC